jgi:hypothetical protein
MHPRNRPACGRIRNPQPGRRPGAPRMPPVIWPITAPTVGRHGRLRCPEPDAAVVLAEHIKEVLDYLERDHVTVTVSRDGVKADSDWA